MFKVLLLILLSLPLSLFAQEVSPKYLKMLEEIININSGTGNFEGSKKIMSILRKEFNHYGFKEQVKGDPSGHQVFAYDRDFTKPKKFLLYGHIDTVFTKDSDFQKMRIEGDKIYGPGIIDMKAGVVMIVNLLEELKSNPEILDQVRIVITDDEETISSFGTPHLDEFGKGIQYGFILEPGLKDGSVVTSHSGVHWIDLMVKGKAAHAGLAHKEGVNACVELGEKIYQISKLTNYKTGLTVSPDVIRGGAKTNIVCDSAAAQIDMRFIKNNELKSALNSINKILKKKVMKSHNTGEQVTFEIKDVAHFSSLESKSTEKMFKLAQAISTEKGIKLTGVHVGYGTDGGHLAEQGMQVLVGNGPYGDGIHTNNEYMTIKSYNERLHMNLEMIKRLAKE